MGKEKLIVQNQFFNTTTIQYCELPKYDLFLSQVIDYLNDKLGTKEFTSNIVQNYIKNEVISKPADGKKKGYTKIHLIQLILLSYMRPILTTDEIKKVFKLAFNDINNHADDIISWELAYQVFSEFQCESLNDFICMESVDQERLSTFIDNNNLNESDVERINVFFKVMTYIAQASNIKKHVQDIVCKYEN